MKYYAKTCGIKICCDPEKNINWRAKKGSRDTYYPTDYEARTMRMEKVAGSNTEED